MIVELFRSVWERRAWALIAPTIVLAVVVVLIMLASSLPADPKLYPVF